MDALLIVGRRGVKKNKNQNFKNLRVGRRLLTYILLTSVNFFDFSFIFARSSEYLKHRPRNGIMTQTDLICVINENDKKSKNLIFAFCRQNVRESQVQFIN